ncbi:MAG: hypothetical protein AUJ49_07740 [Desulfovibrionaceae bacterium CG1_02_65_16]|nr:MAG: hypothetical protein AUJ49_07740 [Desulfovibrionaceae bacterium CG1_02_65_16]
MNNGTVIFTVAGDAGGANALLPVIARLRAAGAALFPAGYATVPDLWRAKDETVLELPAETSIAQAGEMLRAHGAGLLLTGTSVNGVDLERRFVLAARAAGIPTLALLDFWSNYAPRFSSAPGRLDCLPDAIAVMDELAMKEMTAEGFPAHILHVTGQPLFDNLAELRAGLTPNRRKALRASVGVREGERLVAFACQPLNDVYREHGARAVLGYDEWDALPAVIDTLEALRAELPLRLLLLPHPREPKGKYDAAAARSWIAFAPSFTSSREVALVADLMVGMNSMLLMESVLLGTPALSVQPNLRARDALPMSRNGVIPRVERLKELPGVLRGLFGTPAGQALAAQHVSAAGRVAELALRLLNQGAVSGA